MFLQTVKVFFIIILLASPSVQLTAGLFAAIDTRIFFKHLARIIHSLGLLTMTKMMLLTVETDDLSLNSRLTADCQSIKNTFLHKLSHYNNHTQ